MAMTVVLSDVISVQVNTNADRRYRNTSSSYVSSDKLFIYLFIYL